MAEHTALDNITGIAKRMVASAQTENTDAANKVDGQDLNSWLMALFEEPTMDGEKLGRKIIARASEGANDAPEANGVRGTPTLALFDLSQERSFKTALMISAIAWRKLLKLTRPKKPFMS